MTTRKRLLQNFLSLSSIQIVNFLLPLMTLPYLVRALGPHNYGLAMFAQAISQYFVLLTSYGFNLSATPQVAMERENRSSLVRVASAVFASKVILMVASFAMLISIVFLVPMLRSEWVLYLLSFGYVIADVSFPVWLFQGLEDMKYITLTNALAKTLSTALIFVFIRHPGDFLLVPLIMSSSTILGGIVSFSLVLQKYKLRLQMPSKESVRYQLKDGWIVFLSTTSISLYTTSNPVILGFFWSPTVVGYYTAVERLINAGQSLLNVVSQTIYPHVTRLLASSRQEGFRFLHRVTVVMAPVTLTISIVIGFLSTVIVGTLLGNQYEPSVDILKILALLPFMISLSNIMGIQTMLNLKHKKAFMMIILGGAVTNVVLSFTLVPFQGAIGTASSVAVSETVITVSMFLYLRKKGVNLITGSVNYNDI